MRYGGCDKDGMEWVNMRVGDEAAHMLSYRSRGNSIEKLTHTWPRDARN